MNHIILNYIISYYIILYYIILCYMILCFILLSHIMLYYILSYYIISYHIILYYIIYYIILYYIFYTVYITNRNIYIYTSIYPVWEYEHVWIWRKNHRELMWPKSGVCPKMAAMENAPGPTSPPATIIWWYTWWLIPRILSRLVG